jgi:hypothetical protein
MGFIAMLKRRPLIGHPCLIPGSILMSHVGCVCQYLCGIVAVHALHKVYKFPPGFGSFQPREDDLMWDGAERVGEVDSPFSVLGLSNSLRSVWLCSKTPSWGRNPFWAGASTALSSIRVDSLRARLRTAYISFAVGDRAPVREIIWIVLLVYEDRDWFFLRVWYSFVFHADVVLVARTVHAGSTAFQCLYLMR